MATLKAVSSSGKKGRDTGLFSWSIPNCSLGCSGMLPGYVSGFYTHEDCHVDLNRLAHYANARLILQPATGLDMQVCCNGLQRQV